MSYWKTIIEKDFKELNEISYAKLNCIQQEIAERFEKQNLSVVEVFLILEGMRNKIMVNKDNAFDFYKAKYDTLLKYELLSIEALNEKEGK